MNCPIILRDNCGCDKKGHQDDFSKFLLKKDFRIVGRGKPKIIIKIPELEGKYPCLLKQ